MVDTPFKMTPDGVCVYVRLTPNAKKDALGGLFSDGDGQTRLKASVSVVPEKGKANKQLIKMMSKQWRKAGGDFEIVAGQTDRLKTIMLKVATQEDLQQLMEWVK